MAVDDLVVLSSMIKAQLPFLFSFAVMRWVLGFVFGGVGGWMVRRSGFGHHMPVIVSTLNRARAFVYMVTLAGLAAAWAQEWMRSGAPNVCGPHVCARVQGMAAGIGMVVLMTNGSSLALGMALASLKAVADTSASSTMLASITVLFAVRRGQSARACISATSMALTSFVFGCWRGRHGQRYTGGPVTALLVMALYVFLRACVLMARSALRSGTTGMRALLRLPLRACSWVLKGRRAL